MSTAVIPAGDYGSFTIYDRDLIGIPGGTFREFLDTAEREAAARRLILHRNRDSLASSWEFSWEPAVAARDTREKQ